MQKTVVRNPNQSSIRRNLLNIAGITIQGETITPQNGDRLLGGYGVAWLNNQDAASQTTGQDNPLPECNCESGGGGGGGSGGGGGVQPSGNCEKKNISELKQVLDDYAAQSFCDKEFPEVQFSTFIGYDKPPSDSTAKEIELRMLCPSDECVEKYLCDISFGAGYYCLDEEFDNTREEHCVLMSADEVIDIANSFRLEVIAYYQKTCFGRYVEQDGLSEPFTKKNCRITIQDNTMTVVFPLSNSSHSGTCQYSCQECYDPERHWCRGAYFWATCSRPTLCK